MTFVHVDIDVPDTGRVLAVVTISRQFDGTLTAQFHGDSLVAGQSIKLIREMADALELDALVSGLRACDVQEPDQGEQP